MVVAPLASGFNFTIDDGCPQIDPARWIGEYHFEDINCKLHGSQQLIADVGDCFFLSRDTHTFSGPATPCVLPSVIPAEGNILMVPGASAVLCSVVMMPHIKETTYVSLRPEQVSELAEHLASSLKNLEGTLLIKDAAIRAILGASAHLFLKGKGKRRYFVLGKTLDDLVTWNPTADEPMLTVCLGIVNLTSPGNHYVTWCQDGNGGFFLVDDCSKSIDTQVKHVDAIPDVKTDWTIAFYRVIPGA